MARATTSRGASSAALVVLGHEACAVGQAQQAAFAAHRFGNQEGLGLRVVKAGRMELDEFHVGDPAAGAPGHGDAVAGRSVGIRRIQINLAGAAGRDQRIRGAERDDLTVDAVEHVGAKAAVVASCPACRR